MAFQHRTVQPSRIAGRVLSESGDPLIPPEEWAFLQAGDAAITRSVKAKGSTWIVQIRKGRRMMTRGIWANKSDIEESRREVEAKRATPAYAKKRKTDLARRAVKHEQYCEEFCASVIQFLNFHPRYKREAEVLGQKITEHATPVGSGTVARTERIPIDQRAEAASIAWMRHQTTAYDSMRIARIKGKRREVRRQLAAQSVKVLQSYRQGEECCENCPLQQALSKENI